jgi:hypothetical protein
MMLCAGLAAGVKWGFGWDLPQVIRGAEELMLALGAGRFTLTPTVLDESYDLGCGRVGRVHNRQAGVKEVAKVDKEAIVGLRKGDLEGGARIEVTVSNQL